MPNSPPSQAPAALVFRGLSVTAAPALFSKLNDQTHVPSRLIDSISGIARSGELLCILGSSGSDRSILLQALAGQIEDPSVHGTIRVHGIPVNPNLHNHTVKYIPQSAVLYESLTVQETLRSSASFYSPDAALRTERIENAMSLLGLNHLRHVKCGGSFYSGLTVGQRRRVAVAAELVARPVALFLEEPTSGLDSTAAQVFMQYLRKVARTGVAVVCTIHNPTQYMLKLSHRILVLSQGRAVYCGYTSAVVPYFSAQGYSLHEQTSVAEWLLNDILLGSREDSERKTELVDSWTRSTECALMHAEIDAVTSVPASVADNLFNGRTAIYKRNILMQTMLITRRSLIEAVRNPAVIYVRLAMYVLLFIIVGIAWWRMDSTAARMIHRIAALFYMSSLMFLISMAAIPFYIYEKKVVIREKANASYSYLAFLGGHFVMEMIFMAVMSVILSGVVYYMAGFNEIFSRVAFFALTIFMSLLVAESLMVFLAAVAPFPLAGIAIAATLFGFFVVAQGFLRPLNQMSWVFRWVQFVAVHTFSFNALCINELSGRNFAAVPTGSPPIPEDISGDDFLEILGLPLSNKWICIAVLGVMLASYRVLAFIWIENKWNTRKIGS